MKMTFLGSGAAFTLQNFQSNMLIEKNGKRLLIDAGGDIRFSLNEVGLTSRDIDSIYISHSHTDHIGGLEYMGFTTYFDPTKESIKLFCEGELMYNIWDDSIKGGLKSIQGARITLGDYFKKFPIDRENGYFIWEDIKFTIVQVCHIVDCYMIVPSYGLMFKGDNGKNVFITTDTQFAPSQISTFYEQSDIIFQDCETAPFKSGVHAHYTDLATLDKKFKRKMNLYHYQDGEKPDCKKDGFSGWCKKGQVFEL